MIGGVDMNVRVDVKLLDRLMNLVGELVLTRNQMVELTQAGDDLGPMAQRLDLITAELQDGVMKTRMQPISNVWATFPRLVRDLALACEKKVHLEMEGKETELDRTVIEAIKDPLTHLIRNAVDHGIERPLERVANGKPAEGRLTVRAFHEGGHVNVEVSDDGGGIDLAAVRRKAVDKGLVSASQAESMSDADASSLIFVPGFSTAESVTNVSGRGVGMDVVRINIEKIGGTVDVVTHLGTGTTFLVRVPLTLAIIPALLVSSGGERYAIPQVSLLELVRFDRSQTAGCIDMIQGTATCRLRGDLLPLISLGELLDGGVGGYVAGGGRDLIDVIVMQADGRRFGLVVDAVHDTGEIVVKPLGRQFSGLTAYAGATILGDGRVALILDVLGLAERSGVLSTVRGRGVHAEVAGFMGSGSGPGSGSGSGVEVGEPAPDARTLLVLGVGDGSAQRAALALDRVVRLEEFPPDRVERVGDVEVVQYGEGTILPLVRLSGALGVPSTRVASSILPVVVIRMDTGTFGLVVDEILDIVDGVDGGDGVGEHGWGRIVAPSSRLGVAGSAVVAGRATSILDLEALAASLDGCFELAVAR